MKDLRLEKKAEERNTEAINNFLENVLGLLSSRTEVTSLLEAVMSSVEKTPSIKGDPAK